MRKVAVWLVAASFMPPAYGEPAASDFGAHRWPVSPVIIVDAEPKLCSEVLADAKRAFASKAPDFDIPAASLARLKALAWEGAFNDLGQTASTIGRLDLDLDGTGRKQVVIYRDAAFNWKGDWHYAYVFPSEAEFDAARDRIQKEWVSVPGDAQYPDTNELHLGGRQYFPTALSTSTANGTIQTGDVWADHAVFAWHHRYYFFTGLTAFDRLHPSTISVYRLHADGRVNEACRIGIKGEPAYAKFQATPGVGSLLNEIRAIGTGGEDCGTGHWGQQHDEQAKSAEERAATRPWAVSIESQSMTEGAPYYVFDERTQKYVELWSHGDIWSRREYQTFLAHIKPAEDGMASYLVSQFGIAPAKARVDAVAVVQQLIGSRLLIPNQFDMTEDSRNLYFGKYSLDDALVTYDKKGLDSLLAHPASLTHDPGTPSSQVLSFALSTAVEWPYGLDRLLKAGANPDQANKFGKTALMFAAHMDRPDAARALIRAHANVNAITHSVDAFCTGGFDRVGRSALTYAAENASPIVMKLLLDAGADANIKDSKGHHLDYYLARNPRLTEQERALGVTGLAKIADRFAGPSFDCHRASTGMEKAICGDEVLRMFDLEIARAFANFRAQRGKAAVEEQRHWLVSRDTTCGKDSPSANCLAEIMRTRIRYLHDRLAEGTAAQSTAQ